MADKKNVPIQFTIKAVQAFNAAIHDGRLSITPQHVTYAGKYMYMFTDRYGKNQFKNITTRRYLP